VTLPDAIHDRELFGRLPTFRDLGSWSRWRVFLKALGALPMTEAERAIYATHTGRQAPPAIPPAEVFVCAGRRSGKTCMAALIATYLATFRDYRPHLAPGERAMILCVATDREQAGILLRYMRAFVTEVPMLRRMIEAERSDAIELTNRVTLAVDTCSYRAVRGVTLAACVCDEIAFWRVDGANPDREVLTALRPALDDWLMRQPSLVPHRKRAVLPVLLQRQQLVNSLARLLERLGLERKARELPTLETYLATRTATAPDTACPSGFIQDPPKGIHRHHRHHPHRRLPERWQDTASGLKVRRRRASLCLGPSRRTTRERLRAMGAETRFAGVQSAQRGEGATHGRTVTLRPNPPSWTREILPKRPPVPPRT